MAGNDTKNVGRQPDEPSLEQVLSEMDRCEPYTTGELAAEFEDASRWTLHRRLRALHDDGTIKRKEHAANRVSWWRE